LDGAWDHIAGLVEGTATPKPLLPATIGAVAEIRPQEAREMLVDLKESDDEEIEEEAEEAMLMAFADEGEEEEDDDWIN
jgi:hypothetical protein